MLWKFGLFPSINRQDISETVFRWKINEKKAKKALDFISSIQPLPNYWLGPMRLVFDSTFYLKDPQTEITLPNQEVIYDFDDGYGYKTPISNFRLSVSNKVKLSVWLVMPFNEPNENFYSYVSTISKIAPFKLSDKHWRIWHYTKSGSFVARKLNLHT